MLFVLLVTNFAVASSAEGSHVEPPPISIVDCRTGIERRDLTTTTNGNYQITFINVSDRPVVEVRFEIYLADQEVPILDEGSFTTNVQVTHKFLNRGGEVTLSSSAPPTMRCDVQWVRFLDGSEWTEPTNDNGPSD